MPLRRSVPGPRSIPGLPFPSWLDAPVPEDKRVLHGQLVRGWIAVRRSAQVGTPEIVIGDRRLSTQTEPRPEVRPGRWHRQIIGFRRFVTLEPEFGNLPWQLELTVDGQMHQGFLGIEADIDGLAALADAKTRKFPRLEPLLRCPKSIDRGGGAAPCRGELERSEHTLLCEQCGAKYAATAESFDFLTDELRTSSGVEDTDNVSSLGYDPLARELIERYDDGLVLDAGSGLKRPGYEHVVNLEVVAYPSTDVLAVGESLPFADGAFHGALSLAVLEHVRDPFRCAAELARVVRPGGQIYVAVPFLQPYHGYPHHYYNMTLTGLGNLFDQWFTIERSGTPPYGWPVWTLTWFLDRYVAGLPPTVAQRFKEMKVADLLGDASRYLTDDFVVDLADESIMELASVNYLIGTRR